MRFPRGLELSRLWEQVTFRVTGSAITGLFASTFATAALVFSEPSGGIPWLFEGRRPDGALVALAWALAGSLIPASTTVFACWLLDDTARWIARTFRANWHILIGPPLRVAIAALNVAIVVAPAIRRVFLAVARIVGGVLLGGFAVLLYVIAVGIGVVAVTTTTGMMRALLEDPPGMPTMALQMTGIFTLMFIGLGVLAFCLWFLYLLARSARRAF
ncbi:MAG: hypothetical protein M3R54_11095 [Chloroflexota bacterium]|nr:hypothetical protein [Chloroflexota bacterium]